MTRIIRCATDEGVPRNIEYLVLGTRRFIVTFHFLNRKAAKLGSGNEDILVRLVPEVPFKGSSRNETGRNSLGVFNSTASSESENPVLSISDIRKYRSGHELFWVLPHPYVLIQNLYVSFGTLLT